MNPDDAPRPAPAAVSPSVSPAVAPAVSPRRVGLALALLVLVALGPFVAEFSAQTAARYAVAAAVVDDGTIQIDRYEEVTFPSDRVERDGHQYGDKAPGQPLLLAAPLYASARLVGAEPATTERIMGNLGVWWVTLWSSVVPAAILCALMYRTAQRWFPGTAVSAALGLSFGSLLLVFSTQMYGHVLSALLGYAAWVVAERGPRDRWHLVAVGALAGAAVSVEYTLAFVGLFTVAWLVRAGVRAALGWVALGALPFAALIAGWQAAAYGSPLRTAYSLKPDFDAPTIVGVPDVSTLAQSLAGSRGLLLLTPVVLVALYGCVLLLTRPTEVPRSHPVMALLVLGSLLVVQSGWPNPWGGEMPGPRYLIPALPFLAVALARAWQEHALLARAAAVVGGLIMGLGLLTVHLVAEGRQVVPTYLDYLDSGLRTPTLFTLAVGDAGWVLHLGLLALALVHLHRVRFPTAPGPAADRAPAVTAQA